MTCFAYSDEKLMELGTQNYKNLTLCCEKLEESGFWADAEKVMKQSSTQVLDLYLQSLLMNLAIHCGQLLEKQRIFMLRLTKENLLGVPEQGQIPASVITSSKHVYQLPPILVQLCGVYDREKKQDMTAKFLDSLLNILFCMAYLNKGKDVGVNHFVQEYYNKVRLFLNCDQRSETTYSRYIFRKLSAESIQCQVEWLEEKRQRSSYGKQDKQDKTVLEQPVEEQKTSKLQEQPVEEQDIPELQEQPVDEEVAREQFLKVKERLTQREQVVKEIQQQKLDELLEELNELVGLDQVKEEIRSLINLIKIRKLREEMNMPTMDMSYHMVFTGSPGTGKTTVARLVAGIYKELGVLTEGNLVETDRSGLVAGYVGQTAINVKEVVEKAIGGVLFIDEAYSLLNKEVANDFGGEAVDTLVKLMEDNRDNLVVIVAGYTKEMKAFLKCNTGLISRFNKFIDFSDYSVEELLEILKVMTEKAGLCIEEKGVSQVKKYLEEMTLSQWENFGNGRGIRNVFEKIVIQQANRLVNLENPTREQLMTIVEEDVFLV